MSVRSLVRSGLVNFAETRSMLVGNEVFVQRTFELISSSILNATTPSITFDVSTLSSTYKHLQIRLTARTTRAEINDALFFRLNGDTGSNYARHQLFGNGSTVSSIAGTSEGSTGNNAITGSSATANIFGVGIFDFLDVFSSTKNKTIRSSSGLTANFNQVMLASGLWMNTEIVNSINIQANGNFLAGSRFSLYGIRG